ncbi:hypothetical protein GVN24_27860, partial [Rhizobium sp. CRIBSB]|nr:hypothetical protein [Rhizobium sp. CRIBSB]
MTDPNDPAPTADSPAVRARRQRTVRELTAFVAGIVTASLVALFLLILVGGRLYLLTGPGRDLVTSFVSGQKIGSYGRINVEGVSGDLLDDFTIRRVTVTDEKGIWLEAANVRIDWSYWPLLLSRFHASEITADRVRLIRRPIVEASTRPPGAAPLDVDIDRFAAEIELLEGFSKAYGHWSLAASADIPRRGDKDITVDARSLSRPGDYLKLTASLGADLGDMRLNLDASEALGGPLAGALGYSPAVPFKAHAIVDGRIVDAVVRSGAFTPLTVKGQFGPDGSRLSGFLDFSGSDLLAPFVSSLGRRARFTLVAAPDSSRKGVQSVTSTLQADNIASRASGRVRLADYSAPDGIRLEVNVPSLSQLAGHPVGGPARYAGVFTGNATRWTLEGDIAVQAADIASYRVGRISGPLALRGDRGRLELTGDLAARDGATAGIVGSLLGASPRAVLKATRMTDGAILLNRIALTGQALALEGTG